MPCAIHPRCTHQQPASHAPLARLPELRKQGSEIMKTQQNVIPSPTWPLHLREADRTKAADKAKQCIGWLRAQGFEVLCAILTTRNPRIIIKHSPLCEKLEGAVRRFERNRLSECHYWVAIRFECEVRWQEGGAA
jgi:hypothetical protein